MAEQRTRRVTRDGVGLHVVEHGPEDGEAVLLVHGWPDSHRLWRGQVPALVDAGLRVVAHDQRGLGVSDAPEQTSDYAIAEAAADAHAVLDALSLERVHLVGHDWGAAACWGVAAFAPERVASLTALSVGHPNTNDLGDVSQRELSWYMLLFQFEEAAERWLREDDWAGLRALCRRHPEAERWITDLSRPGRLTASLAWYRANLHPDRWFRDRPPLPSVAVPSLGVIGGADAMLAPRQMLESHAQVTGRWRCEVLDGVGHWIPLDAPELLNPLLLGWLAEHPTDG